MGLKEQYNFEYLVNEAEDLVLKELENQIRTAGKTVCTCEDCILDMAAYALNHIKPNYRVTLMGRLYARSITGTGYEQEIVNAVGEAIEVVSENPMHG